MITRSTLAAQVSRPRDVDDRTLPVWGLCVHTTGSGIVDNALKLRVDPLDHAVHYYLTPGTFFPHYVCGWDGRLVQVADELERAQHVGFAERSKYLSGAWEKAVAPALLARWKARWPGFKSPAHLFPGSSPNNVYIGVELTPLPKRDPANGLFTVEQYRSVAALANDIGTRWALGARWWRGPRLLGHEDLNPITRPGWDPGALRVVPDFQWSAVLGRLETP